MTSTEFVILFLVCLLIIEDHIKNVFLRLVIFTLVILGSLAGTIYYYSEDPKILVLVAFACILSFSLGQVLQWWRIRADEKLEIHKASDNQ